MEYAARQPQRVIVAVKWGSLDGRKVVISPGEVVCVGRSERAGLVVPHDALMSAAHFEVSWDGVECRFRDLKSAKGTLLNGEAGVSAAVVVNGDWLKAGETVFTVHLEGATPARLQKIVDEEAEVDVKGGAKNEASDQTAKAVKIIEDRRVREAVQKALAMLKAEADKEPLFAVLDRARDKRIGELLQESVEEHRSLYDGVQGEALAEVAPYLVRLPAESRLLEALVQEGWGKRWGIYLTSKQPFKEVRRHLRRFLMVEMEETEELLYFRFYDPRTLRTFLPASTRMQSCDFFTKMSSFIVESEGREALRFQME